MRARLRRLLHDQRGISMFELLIVMVILGIVMTGLTTTFASATQAQVQMTRRFEAQQAGRLALDELRREAHCASTASVTGTSLVTLTFPTTGSSVSCSAGSGVANVTWCVRSGTTGNELYRITSATTTCSGGTLEAEYVATTSVFALELPTAGSGALAKLRVTLPVDLSPSSTAERYTLEDDIALRNTTRA